MRKITIFIGIVLVSFMALALECKEHDPLKKRAITEWRFKRVKGDEMDSKEEDLSQSNGDKSIPLRFMFRNFPIYKNFKESQDFLEA